MGCCNSHEIKNINVSIYIPSWDKFNNIGAIRRTTALLHIAMYIGEKGNRGNGDRPVNGRITSKELKGIERVCMGVGSNTIVTNPLDLFALVDPSTVFILMETFDYWNDRKIVPTSLYALPLTSNMMFVFGNERDGISEETVNMFKNYVPCYLPQDETLVNTRAIHNNVSLNLAHTVSLTVGVIKGKIG